MMSSYEILTVVNVPQSDNDDVIDDRLTGIVSSDARVILLYATPSVSSSQRDSLSQTFDYCARKSKGTRLFYESRRL